MKKQNYLLTGALFLMSSIAFAQVQKAQTVQVGNTSTNTMNPSAVLQMDDTTRGFLQPRMTTTQRTAIANPATGLQVYDTTTSSIWYYNGTSWVSAVTKFVDGTTAANAVFTGGNVGINTIAPTERLEVVGNIKADRLLAYGAGGLNTNVAIGGNSLNANTTGNGNNAVGFDVLKSNTIGAYNSGIGLGVLSLNTTGSKNFGAGYAALGNNTTGQNNFALGYAALRTNITGSYNFAVGEQAGMYAADGTTGLTNSSNSIFLGNATKALANDQTNQIVIGSGAIGLGSNSVVLGNNSVITTALKGNVGIGTTNPTVKLEVNGIIKVGSETVTTPTAGMIRFNTTNSKFEGYDGTAWQPLN